MKSRGAMLGLIAAATLGSVGMLVRAHEDDLEPESTGRVDREKELAEFRERQRFSDAHYGSTGCQFRRGKRNKYTGEDLRALRAERGCGRPPGKGRPA